MGVYRDKLRDNRWCYEFQLGGRRYRGVCRTADGDYVKSKGNATLAEAAARKKVKDDQGVAKNGIQPGAYTLAMALDRHIGKTGIDSSASHIGSLNRIASEMLKHFGLHRAVVDIGADDVEGYRKFLSTQKRKVWKGGPRKMIRADLDNPRLWKELDKLRSASEVNHCLDFLRCALRGVHKMRDPVTGVSMLPFPPEIEPVFAPERDPTPMSEAEFRARLHDAPSWVVDAANLAWWFGLRNTEALTLELRHLDYENQCLRLLGGETKSGKDQAVYGGREGWIIARWLARKARRRRQKFLVTWPGRHWFKKARRGRPSPTMPGSRSRRFDGPGPIQLTAPASKTLAASTTSARPISPTLRSWDLRRSPRGWLATRPWRRPSGISASPGTTSLRRQTWPQNGDPN